jgi:hypothetical protein
MRISVIVHIRSSFSIQIVNTQVSLVPPPWLELTTSEPSFSATRVSPPGTMRDAIAPGQHERPQIDMARRNAGFDAQVGQVDSASVGWAMKLAGSRLSLARNASMGALLAAGRSACRSRRSRALP